MEQYEWNIRYNLTIIIGTTGVVIQVSSIFFNWPMRCYSINFLVFFFYHRDEFESFSGVKLPKIGKIMKKTSN